MCITVGTFLFPRHPQYATQLALGLCVILAAPPATHGCRSNTFAPLNPHKPPIPSSRLDNQVAYLGFIRVGASLSIHILQFNIGSHMSISHSSSFLSFLLPCLSILMWATTMTSADGKATSTTTQGVEGGGGHGRCGGRRSRTGTARRAAVAGGDGAEGRGHGRLGRLGGQHAWRTAAVADSTEGGGRSRGQRGGPRWRPATTRRTAAVAASDGAEGSDCNRRWRGGR
uniref:DUF4220 domain-containing protein n=1 Tax=Oryza meridionalis TaxID=40149 RepID=A0A0E0CSN6_9ORYZ